MMTSPDEECVYEVVDRLTNRRAMEIIFRTAHDAFAWLESATDDDKAYRVQGVKVWDCP